MRSISRYLSRCADLASTPLHASMRDGVRTIVVIPALAEEEYLWRTLESLRANAEALLRETLVICVVNNRAPGAHDPTLISENQRTLTRLRAAIDGETLAPLRLACIDASSPGHELPPDQGVGLARKLGLDWGLQILVDNGARDGVLCWLDADTLAPPDYLEAIRVHYARPDAWAAVTQYEHPIDGENAEAIIAYETYLRYHALGLRYAGSPYAFHTIGSTITCRAEAYAAVSGMNRRQAGEDFYFLQELRKTGRVDVLRQVIVQPSARVSDRVPFGTGPRMRGHLSGGGAMLLDPRCYEILRQWLTLSRQSAHDGSKGEAVFAKAAEIEPELASYIERVRFVPAWDKLQRNSRDATGLEAQFHRWFDGLKTLRLLHHLRDTAFPLCVAGDAAERLLNMVEVSSCEDGLGGAGLAQGRPLLQLLRRLDMDLSAK